MTQEEHDLWHSMRAALMAADASLALARAGERGSRAQAMTGVRWIAPPRPANDGGLRAPTLAEALGWSLAFALALFALLWLGIF